MLSERGGIDPDKLGKAIRTKLGLEAEYDDSSVYPIYRVRWWEYSRKWNGPSLMAESLGCNEDCAHCYVPVELLRANIDSEVFQKRLRELPAMLRQFPQNAEMIIEYAGKQFIKKFGTTHGGVIELTGGEPTIFPGGIRRLGELARPYGITIGINTDGYLIGVNPEFLDRFDGLQDTLKFLVSIKGLDPIEFRRFSHVRGEYYLTPFEAARRIAESGFGQPFLGVTVDTIAGEGRVKEDIERLMAMIDEYGLDKKMIIWDKITEQIMGNWLPTRQKMIDRGYYTNSEGRLHKKTNRKEVTDFLEKNYGVNKSCIK